MQERDGANFGNDRSLMEGRYGVGGWWTGAVVDRECVERTRLPR